MEKCPHKLKHTEYHAFQAGIHMFNSTGSYEITAIPARIDTFCADCGKLLKTVELKEQS